jgi:hypothetical protein
MRSVDPLEVANEQFFLKSAVHKLSDELRQVVERLVTYNDYRLVLVVETINDFRQQQVRVVCITADVDLVQD